MSAATRFRKNAKAHVCAMCAAALVLPAYRVPAAQAQDTYPSRVVRIVVPTAPGGPSDISARIIAQELSKRWGRQVVVDVRPGAGTIIGSEIVARAPPDGYTLLVSPSTLAINPASYKKMPYDALRDFAPITQTLYVPNLIAVHPSLPARSVKEVIALAKARPGEILYGSAGHGTNPHLTVELFASMAGIRLLHVPYKGTLPGLVDLVAGRVALLATSSMSLVVPHVRAGRLRALGVTSAARTAALPDISTIAEAGLPGYEAVQWSGLLAPAGTPREIVVKLHQESTAILRTAEARERLAADSAELVLSSPEEFAAFLKAETVKWARVAKAAGIQPE
jgi:tripartite-type tricarboxylate transporter receptor subunit TctC